MWRYQRNTIIYIGRNHQVLIKEKYFHLLSTSVARTSETLAAYRINRGVIFNKSPKHPLLGPSGLIYDPATKSELFSMELEK